MDNRIRLTNYAYDKEQYMNLIRAKSTLQGYRYMICCQDDKNLEALRNTALVALDTFLKRVGEVVYEEERMITEMLDNPFMSTITKIKKGLK